MPSVRLRSLTAMRTTTTAPLPNSECNFLSNSLELLASSSNPFDVRISSTLWPKGFPTASRTVLTSTEENAFSAANLWSGLNDAETDSELPWRLVELDSRARTAMTIMSLGAGATTERRTGCNLAFELHVQVYPILYT